MNSCHHSGIHAVFSFVHLLLVLAICFDTLSLSCLLSLTDTFGISFPISSLQLIHSLFFLLEFTHTHASSLTYNWLIMFSVSECARAHARILALCAILADDPCTLLCKQSVTVVLSKWSAHVFTTVLLARTTTCKTVSPVIWGQTRQRI